MDPLSTMAPGSVAVREGKMYRKCDGTCDSCPHWCFADHPIGCTCDGCLAEFDDNDDEDFEDE